MKTPKTVIVTGASQGIGACLVKTFLERGYQVVATARSMEKSGFQASKQLALVDGDIGEVSTAKRIVETTVERFGGVAVNVDYRLAPEHTFPTAVQDAYDALKWVCNAVSPLRPKRY
jgi:NAD(P)-dependent dehydrogenase (short-subunit alcohol dehydrogenase family)